MGQSCGAVQVEAATVSTLIAAESRVGGERNGPLLAVDSSKNDSSVDFEDPRALAAKVEYTAYDDRVVQVSSV